AEFMLSDSENLTRVSNWLVTQTDADLRTTYGVVFPASDIYGDPVLGFTGFGALGGGNLTLSAGGSADRLNGIAIGGSGPVSPTGSSAQTGGGTLKIDVRGTLAFTQTETTENSGLVGNAGAVSNLRGDVVISAGGAGDFSPGNGRGGPDLYLGDA